MWKLLAVLMLVVGCADVDAREPPTASGVPAYCSRAAALGMRNAVYLPAELPADVVAAAEAAVNAWNEAAGVTVFQVFRTDLPWGLANSVVVSVSAGIAERDRIGEMVSEGSNYRVRVLPGLGKQLRAVMEHELGHAIGLEHDADGRSVMHESLVGSERMLFEHGAYAAGCYL